MATGILIYEDNESLRKSIQTLLLWNTKLNVIAALSNAVTAAEDVSVLKPDVILMDIDMPACSGVQAVTNIRKVNKEIPIIMFTVFEDAENIYNAICAGANGYLLKKEFEQIPTAIEDVLNGGAPMTSSVAKKVLSFVPVNNQQKSKEVKELLSEREIEVLEYIVKGFSYKMIASELAIAVETVRSHIKKIYKKLQVNNATEAVYKYSGK
jgi:DNA-binding NarL/FixJ family response regulator